MGGGGEGRCWRRHAKLTCRGTQVAVLICCPRSLEDFLKWFFGGKGGEDEDGLSLSLSDSVEDFFFFFKALWV